MELLMMQFNRGHMTSHMCGQVVGQLWDKIKDKFTQDDKGLWYNVRLEEEQIKRKKFTETRRNNLSGVNQYTKKGSKKAGHMTSHMENENINGINTIVDSTTIVDAENEIHFGKVNGHKVMIQKVYVTDKVKVIHDLRDYFLYTNQLAEIERAGLTKFDEFMEANPANIFKDDSHLYNSFRKFCQDGGSVKKKVNKGKIQ